MSQAFSAQALGTEQKTEPGRRAQWRLEARGCLKQLCVEWWLVSGGSRPWPGQEGQEESHVLWMGA